MSEKLPLRCSEVLWIEKHAGNDSGLNSPVSRPPRRAPPNVTDTADGAPHPGAAVSVAKDQRGAHSSTGGPSRVLPLTVRESRLSHDGGEASVPGTFKKIEVEQRGEVEPRLDQAGSLKPRK